MPSRNIPAIPRRTGTGSDARREKPLPLPAGRGAMTGASAPLGQAETEMCVGFACDGAATRLFFLLAVVFGHNGAAVVGTATQTHPMRQFELATLGTGDQMRGCQLPVGAAALVSALLGYFTLWDCHALHHLTRNKKKENRIDTALQFTAAGRFVEIAAAAMAEARAILAAEAIGWQFQQKRLGQRLVEDNGVAGD